ncbi:NVEALA domain-containing protein [Bacteroides salyersiae]|jgi:hypothetical protein|uniref:NVEALA domain-containing protein n=1 Tax=Bacteroides salyersiae TaxID=291644 RepID=UPI001C8B7893|nr:NVEALA domain-containing protein [Bacteroides salyersiae]
MRKFKLFTIMFLIVVLFAGYNIYTSSKRELLSELALANIEALANDGESTKGYIRTSSDVESKEENDCYVVITTVTTVRCTLGGWDDCTPGTYTTVEHLKKPDCPN